jgi:hypothetical protein
MAGASSLKLFSRLQEPKRSGTISVFQTLPAGAAWQSLVPNRSCVPMIASSLSRATLSRAIWPGPFINPEVAPQTADILLISE